MLNNAMNGFEKGDNETGWPVSDLNVGYFAKFRGL